MAGLGITDFVLLASRFQVVGEAAERVARMAIGPLQAEQVEEAAEPEQPSADDDPDASELIETTLEGVSLRYRVTVEEDEFVLILQAWITDESVPYEVEVIVGSRFTIPTEDSPTTQQVAATLMFMTYPYLRETIANITVRSPYPAYQLPPLARLPHPRVLEPDGQ